MHMALKPLISSINSNSVSTFLRINPLPLSSSSAITSCNINHLLKDYFSPDRATMISAKKLMNMIQQWQDLAALRRKRTTNSSGDGLDSCFAISSVDKGHFAIYTADDRRFVVPLAYLNNPVFRQLLEMSEEEYGLPSDGPIVLPCDSVFMDYAISLIRKGRAGDLHEAAVVKSVTRSRCSSSCLYQGQMNQQFLIH